LRLRSTRRVESVVEVGCAWMVEVGIGKIAGKPGMNYELLLADGRVEGAS
jgi:hypothetical protein